MSGNDPVVSPARQKGASLSADEPVHYAPIMQNMKTWIFALLPLLFLVACSRTHDKLPDLTIDRGLRALLSVRSLTGVSRIPLEDTAYLVTVLEFEDGKLARRGLATFGKVEHLQERVLMAELLWSTYEGEPRVALVSGGMSARSRHPFWSKLDGGWASLGPDVHREQFDGFTILGFAESDVTRDGRTNTASGGSFSEALRIKKLVGALALKTYGTFEDASRDAEIR